MEGWGKRKNESGKVNMQAILLSWLHHHKCIWFLSVRRHLPNIYSWRVIQGLWRKGRICPWLPMILCLSLVQVKYFTFSGYVIWPLQGAVWEVIVPKTRSSQCTVMHSQNSASGPEWGAAGPSCIQILGKTQTISWTSPSEKLGECAHPAWAQSEFDFISNPNLRQSKCPAKCERLNCHLDFWYFDDISVLLHINFFHLFLVLVVEI